MNRRPQRSGLAPGTSSAAAVAGEFHDELPIASPHTFILAVFLDSSMN
jgi:hypothetical protein